MVTYRLAEESDYENINAFYNKMYNANRTIQQFRWEFVDGPFGSSIYVIAFDAEHQIVGTNCVIPMKVVNGNGEITLTGKSEDTLVNPAFRGQNIFYNIYDFLFDKCKDRGIKAIWGFTSAKKPFSKLGFDIPYDHEQSIIVGSVLSSYFHLSSLNAQNDLMRKVKIFGLCLMGWTKRLTSFNTSWNDEFTMEHNVEIINGVDDLMVSQNVEKHFFSILQNEEFQRWRIYNNPNYDKLFTYGFYNKRKELKGMFVLNAVGDKTAFVLHTTFDNSVSQSARIWMLQKSCENIFSKGISLIRNWHFSHNLVNSNEVRAFEKAGFLHLKIGIGFVWKDLTDAKLDPMNFVLSRVASQGTV